MKEFLGALLLVVAGFTASQDANAAIISQAKLDGSGYMTFGSAGTGTKFGNDPYPIYLDLTEAEDGSSAVISISGFFAGDDGVVRNFSMTENLVRGVLDFGPGVGYTVGDTSNSGNIGGQTFGLVGANMGHPYSFGISKVDTGVIDPVTLARQFKIEAHGWLVNAAGIYSGDILFNATGSTAVPEPATLSLIGAGLAGVASRRRKAKAA